MARAALHLLLFPALAVAQADPTDVAKIIAEGQTRSQAARTLTELGTKIGPRLTGSPQFTAAEKWAMHKFKGWGLQNVHIEEGVTVPVGFERGRRQRARMIEPFESEFKFWTTNAWTNGTRGSVRGSVVAAPISLEDLSSRPGDFKGKWVLLPKSGPRGTKPTVAPEVVKELNALDILGTVRPGPQEAPMTGGTWTDKTFESHPGKPAVILGLSDGERLARQVSFGRRPVIEVDAENRWLKGPVVCHNVVAEIVGSEKPDEVVIVSGHLDSWNGPGSQGAADNGTGTTSAMEAARILAKSGVRPKRTIRFILWTGEEQGLYGSRRYVKDHEAELPKISAVFVDDAGANYIGGYPVLASQRPYFEPAVAALNAAFPKLPMKLDTIDKIRAGGGSDHAPFNAVGVPGFFSYETGDFDYGYIYHNGRDRVSEVVPKFTPYLVQSGTAHAVIAFTLAQAPTLLPRQ